MIFTIQSLLITETRNDWNQCSQTHCIFNQLQQFSSCHPWLCPHLSIQVSLEPPLKQTERNWIYWNYTECIWTTRVSALTSAGRCLPSTHPVQSQSDGREENLKLVNLMNLRSLFTCIRYTIPEQLNMLRTLSQQNVTERNCWFVYKLVQIFEFSPMILKVERPTERLPSQASTGALSSLTVAPFLGPGSPKQHEVATCSNNVVWASQCVFLDFNQFHS